MGTRRATEYGKDFCETLIRDLSEYFPQLVIVSGLAYGIDICAHRCALRHGLNTIAVLAHGLDHIYPANHRSTAVEMVSHGGLLTEYTATTVCIRHFCRTQPHCGRTRRCRCHRGIEGKRRGTHHCRYSRKLPP